MAYFYMTERLSRESVSEVSCEPNELNESGELSESGESGEPE